MSVSSQIPFLFQSAYTNHLLKSQFGGGGLGGFGDLTSQFGVMGGSFGSPSLNPLSGNMSVTGINGFVQDIMFKSQLRKMGLLPPTNSSQFGFGNPFGNAGFGLGTTGFGGPEQQMMMLLSMFNMLQSTLQGGGGAPVGGGFQPTPISFQQPPIQQPPPPQVGGGGFFNSIGNFFGGAMQTASNIFARIGDGFARIDNAIGGVLGGIFNTLPLARL